MRIVFLNRYFAPDISATSQLLTDLATHLAAQGHEVHVICSRQMYEDASARLPAQESLNGVNVHRMPTTRFGRKGLAGRALDYLSFYASAALMLWRLADARSVVVAKTDPPLLSVPAGWVAAWRRAPLVNWVQDLFPEIAQALGVRLFQGAMTPWVRRLRDASLRRARANVVLGERMAERVACAGVPSNRIRIIANWSDADSAAATRSLGEDTRRELGLTGRFVVMYSGNMGRAHEFDTLLSAAAALQRDPRFVFLMVGGGAQRDALEQQARQLSLTNMVFRPYQPRERLFDSLAAADVHIVSLRRELEGLIVPSKVYGVMAVARPVVFVGDTDGEVARLVRRHDMGAAVAQGDGARLARVLAAYAYDPALCARQGRAAHEALRVCGAKAASLAAWVGLLAAVANDHE